jgi:hypothetical protein
MPSAKAKGKEDQGGEDPHLYDFFAGLAMLGLAAHVDIKQNHAGELARWAYDTADAMLQERARRKYDDR